MADYNLVRQIIFNRVKVDINFFTISWRQQSVLIYKTMINRLHKLKTTIWFLNKLSTIHLSEFLAFKIIITMSVSFNVTIPLRELYTSENSIGTIIFPFHPLVPL